MKNFSYWQSPSYISSPPPYILLGLASAKFVLGDNFQLLTSSSVIDIIGENHESKLWKFSGEIDTKKQELMSIVAKSDYIRMAVMEKVGGMWIDADTIFLKDYADFFEKLLPSNNNLAWHSEQFFGAASENQIIKEACSNMLASDVQKWGNPGDLKNLITSRSEIVTNIPYSLVTPGFVPEYTYNTRDIMLDSNISADEFLLNSKQHILKLYNTPFSGTVYGNMSVSDFLNQDILLTKIFLKINPNKNEWIDMADGILLELLKK